MLTPLQKNNNLTSMAVFDNRVSVNKVTLDDTQRLTCAIEAAENAHDHTVYQMRVQRGPISENSWPVWRRYSDFSSLHNYLQTSGVEQLVLPPKKVFGKMDREFVAERQQGLQNYINVVLAHPVLSMCLQVKRFLDPHNYDMNFLEKALQHVSMVFRSEAHWEVVEPLPELGWRLRKHYFLVKPKIDPKERLLLYWVPFGPDKFLEDKDLQNAVKLLGTVQHPYLYPSAYCGATENGGVVIRNFNPNGSLRDLICKCKPRTPFIKKYSANSKNKEPNQIPPEFIAKVGRQILTALKFLHDKGFGHGHLHLGNVIMENDQCQLMDAENHLIGLPSFYRPFIVQLRKVQTLENIDVYSFGHLIYELTFGEPLLTSTCDHFPPHCSPELRSVLEAILTTEACKNGLPSIANLLQHPFFGNGINNEGKVSFKVSSQMKDCLRRSREQMEHRLREEQKFLRHNQRVSRAQAQLNSQDHIKKRQSEKRKQQKHTAAATEHNNSSGASNGPTPSPTPLTPTASPVPAGVAASTPPMAPPPPPPPPPPTPLTSPEGSTPTSNPDRSALLGSIVNFNPTKLKKAVTKDNSGPKV